MILVTGATGTIGSEVVRQLRAASLPVRILARDPAKAAARLPAGVEVVAGDLGDPATLKPALAGVEQVFLLAAGPDLARLEANVIAEARRAGVRHVVKLSAMGADADPGFPYGQWHKKSEDALRVSGLTWTILRPTGFMSNVLTLAPSIRATGKFHQPTGDGKLALIDPRDIAAVTVKALTVPGHEGRTYTLTGPEALSAADMAAELTKATGKPVEFVDVPEEVAAAALKGMPQVELDALLDYLARVRAKAAETVTRDVYRVLLKQPRTFAAWAAENAAAFG
jgi:uncharacterized protein YbjT (DUF2867 family)